MQARGLAAEWLPGVETIAADGIPRRVDGLRLASCRCRADRGSEGLIGNLRRTLVIFPSRLARSRLFVQR